MLVNKRLTVGNINLIRCMFPKFIVVDETNYKNNTTRPAIFKGDLASADNFVEHCVANNLDYIVIGIFSDIDLNDRRILANIIFEKYRKACLPKYLDSIIDNIDNEDFIEEVKIKWFADKWNIRDNNSESGFLLLVDSINKSKVDLLNTYFSVIDKEKSYKLESSMLTFLQRAKMKNTIGLSPNYKKKLDIYKGKKLEDTLNAIEDSLDYNIDNSELRLLNLLLNIQSGKS